MARHRCAQTSRKLAQVGLPASFQAEHRGAAYFAPSAVARASKLDNDLRGSSQAAGVRSDDFRIDPKECNRESASGHFRFLQSSLSCPQKVWKAPPRDRPVKTQRVPREVSFQDGYGLSDPGIHRTGHVGSISGSVRRLPSHSHAPGSSQLSFISNRRSSVPLPRATIRSVDRPLRIFRGHEISEEVGESHRSTAVSVLRRLATTQSGSINAGSPDEDTSTSVSQTRASCQLQEVRVGAHPEHSVLGRPIQFRAGLDSSYSGPLREDLPQNWSHDYVVHDNSQALALSDGSARLDRENSPSGKGTLSRIPASSHPDLDPELARRSPRRVEQRTAVVPSLVDLTIECLARRFDERGSPNFRDPDRCFHIWMGIFLSRKSLAGCVVSRGLDTTHQLSRNAGRLARLRDLITSVCRSRGQFSHRQCHYCCLHKEPGGHALSGSVRSRQEDSAERTEKEILVTSEAHRRSAECDRRLSFAPRPSNQHRVESRSGDVHLDSTPISVGSSCTGPVCEPAQSQTAALCLALPGPSRGNNQFSNCSVAGSRTVRVSSDNTSGPSASEDTSGASTSAFTRSSTLAGSTVVPDSGSPASSGSGPASGLVATTDATSLGSQSSQPDAIQSVPVVHSFSFLKDQGFSGGVLERMNLTHAPSTNKAYLSQWKLFTGWCERQGLKPESATSVLVADFFVYLFKERKVQARTVESYRAALQFYLLRTSGYDLSKCTVLTDLVRSFKIERPVLLKTPVKWNLSIVLDYLVSDLFALTTVSDKNLTHKTLFLVALAAGKRRGELHALERASVLFDSQMLGVTLKPYASFVGKTHIASKGLGTLTEILIPALSPGQSQSGLSSLCPVTCLQAYITRTDRFRGADQRRLFVSFVRGKSSDITSQTISRYIKQTIVNSYESLNLFTDEQLGQFHIKAHQVRHVAHSMGQLKGVALEDIVKAGGWTSSNTFISRYLQDVPSAELDSLSRAGSFVAIEQVFTPSSRSPFCFRDTAKKPWRGNKRGGVGKKT